MLEFFNRYIFGVIVPLGLMAAGVFYAWRLRGLYLRHPGVIIRGMLGRGGGVGMPPGRALSLALAGTLGVGNIVGVASAIYLGGFGAVFWMWVSALAAMLLKYAETVIALNHRRLGGDGLYHGGPMFYIRDFFDSRGLGFAGRLLAVVFALLCIIDSMAMGCVIQVNAVTSAFYGVMGLTRRLRRCFYISCGGRDCHRSAGHLGATERLVPLMTIIYIVPRWRSSLARPGEVFRALGKYLPARLLLQAPAGVLWGM